MVTASGLPCSGVQHGSQGAHMVGCVSATPGRTGQNRKEPCAICSRVLWTWSGFFLAGPAQSQHCSAVQSCSSQPSRVAMCVLLLEPTDLTNSLSIWSLVDLDPMQGGERAERLSGMTSGRELLFRLECSPCLVLIEPWVRSLSTSFTVHGGSQLRS